ncbi:MAG: ABC transporter ATP-binding protein [Bacteroidetes bacterium]|nr:MAG: ABC transporter ATP-binding protein [Bacteroidota bacterium]
MIQFQEKVGEVRRHLQGGDTDLGFRRLVDCVLDTQNKDHYRQLISLTDWKESEERDVEELCSKMIEFLDELKKSNVPVQQKERLLTVHQLNKTYSRGKFCLGDIDLEIRQGDVWGLVGENGNGKTTLLRILARELAYDKGTMNYALPSGKDYDLRSKLVYIPQRTKKWYGTLKDNLKLTAAHYGVRGELNELLVLVYMIRFGLWKYRDFYWRELSSGYKMRFELVRTFLRSPKILLLDEPLANLDVLSQQLILDDLKSLAQSLANPIGIVLSSQQLYEVEKVSDSVLFLKEGKPTHLKQANEDEVVRQTVIELDARVGKEELIALLQDLNPEKLNFNGGIYLLTLASPNAMGEVLKKLVESNVEITYIRDISKSTRRFFS